MSQQQQPQPVKQPQDTNNKLNGHTNVNGRLKTEVADPEVVLRGERRQFTAEYKRRILAEAAACHEPGEIGALLRREGLYSSHLTRWRQKQAEAGQKGLADQKRGRPGAEQPGAEIARLQAENERLQAQLEQATLIMDVQKKLSQLLGLRVKQTGSEESV